MKFIIKNNVLCLKKNTQIFLVKVKSKYYMYDSFDIPMLPHNNKGLNLKEAKKFAIKYYKEIS